MNTCIDVTPDGVVEATHVAPVQKAEKQNRQRGVLLDQFHNRLQAKYDAAQTTFENERLWANADLLSADAGLNPEVRHRLIERSRYEAANSSLYAGALESHASAMIGTGPNKKFRFTKPKDQTASRDLFREHSRAIHLAEKCRQLVVAHLRDGEGLAVPFTNQALPTTGAQLDLRVVDCLQLQDPWLSDTEPNNIDGVVLGQDGEPKEYRILDTHPRAHTWGAAQTYTTYPVDSVVHLFTPDLPGQHRGCPAVTPVLSLFAQFRRYKLAVLTAAETAANVAAMLQMDTSIAASIIESSDPGAEAGIIRDPSSLMDLPRGSIPALPFGYTLTQIDAKQPTDTVEMFERVLLREISRAFGSTYNVLTGDSSGSNMASGTLDERRWWRFIETCRTTFEEKLLDRWVQWWWGEQRLLLSSLSAAARRRPLPRHSTTWPNRFEHADPAKVASATATYHSLGLLPDEAYFDSHDMDPQDMYEMLERQRDARDRLGLSVVGPGVDSNERSQDAEDS